MEINLFLDLFTSNLHQIYKETISGPQLPLLQDLKWTSAHVPTQTHTAHQMDV